MSTRPVTLDMSTAQPIQAAPVKIDMSTAQPLDPSFLERLANQPTQFSRLNPLYYADKLGQGMAQGVEALAHPVDTAKGIYKMATEQTPHDPAGDKPLLEGLGDVADTVLQGWGQAATGAAVGKGIGLTGDAAASSLKPILRATGKAATAVGDSIDTDVLGLITPRGAHLAKTISKAGAVLENYGSPKPVYPGAPLPENPGELTLNPKYPGAPLPATPAPEVLNPSLVSPARSLPGQVGAERLYGPYATGQGSPINAPQQIGPQLQHALPPAPEPPPVAPASVTAKPSLTAAGFQDAKLAGRTSGTSDAPRFLQGESALRQILTGQDNANLMKIAKSRGINVTQESQLRPGVADNRLITKIIDDHTPEELDDIRDAYMQNQSKHLFGDIGPEAWKTLSMQTYFPDVKLPATTIQRTSSAIEMSRRAQAAAAKTPAPPSGDLTPLLQESLKRFQAAKAQ